MVFSDTHTINIRGVLPDSLHVLGGRRWNTELLHCPR